MGQWSSWGHKSGSPCLFRSAQKRSGNSPSSWKKALTDFFPERESWRWASVLAWLSKQSLELSLHLPLGLADLSAQASKEWGLPRACGTSWAWEPQRGGGRREEGEWARIMEEKREIREANFIPKDGCGGSPGLPPEASELLICLPGSSTTPPGRVFVIWKQKDPQERDLPAATHKLSTL